MTNSRLTFLLVHGGMHGGWCWRRVTDLLDTEGFRWFTPTLTGMGERVHLLTREVGLQTHIDDIIGVMEYEDLNNVILVGHSYGGIIITAVAEQLASRINHLIYLAAFIPEDNKSFGDLQPPETLKRYKRLTAEKGDNWRLEPEEWFLDLWGIADKDREMVRSKLTAFPMKCEYDPFKFTTGNSQRLPRTYIQCTSPRLLSLDPFVERTKSDPNWNYVEIATGHDAMISAPKETADLFISIGQELLIPQCSESGGGRFFGQFSL